MTVLYFHGGGYSFYPQSYANFIALITLAAKSKTFALDYRLSPSIDSPAQLEDALNAYRWLLRAASILAIWFLQATRLAVTWHWLCFLAARDSKLPLPALAHCALPGN